MAKRDYRPPYEIMRSRDNPSGSEGRASSDHQADDAFSEASSEPRAPSSWLGRGEPWWVGSASPLVLRVPRGIAVLSVVGLLLLVVIAYQVGLARGTASSAKKQVIEGGGDRSSLVGWLEGHPKSSDGPRIDVPKKPLTAEEREPGHNYMQLVQSTKQDCEMLEEFFEARGVAIQLVPVHNGRSWIAYAVKRGYRKDELKSDSRKLYEQQLRLLGRQFKQSGGYDVSSMYFVRYDG